MENKKLKAVSLEEMKDKYIGEVGTPDRDLYEFDLKLDILGEMVRVTRKKRNLTQEQLGQLIGVKKAEISKLERNARNMTLSTVLKIFNALKANVKFRIELDNQEWSVA